MSDIASSESERPAEEASEPSAYQRPPDPEFGRFIRLLTQTRVVILFGALASLIASVVLLVQSLLAVVQTSWDALSSGDFGKTAIEHVSIEFLSLTDSILLGTVLYIIALGLYQLFFEPDLPAPGWLRFHSLTHLKETLIEVILVLLGVLFVGRAVSWTGGDDILSYGLAVAAVITAFGLILFIGFVRGRRDQDS